MDNLCPVCQECKMRTLIRKDFWVCRGNNTECPTYAAVLPLYADIVHMQDLLSEIGSIVDHAGYGDSKDDIVGAIQEALYGYKIT